MLTTFKKWIACITVQLPGIICRPFYMCGLYFNMQNCKENDVDLNLPIKIGVHMNA